MMSEKLMKIFSLVRKTGDKVILADENGENALVIMPLEEYEKMVFQTSPVSGLTEEEMLDRINQDITRWQATQDIPTDNQLNLDKKTDSGEDDAEEERYYVEPIE